jgi:glycosyltransferase involved in cell wall biosynthesis
VRILVHEYVGHPFAFELSDELARRGHDVLHLYCAQFPSPKAIPGRQPGPARVEGLRLPRAFRKYDYLSRRALDIAHGKQVAARLGAFAPDLVISSTTPLDAQRFIQAAATRSGAGFVYWLQDLYSLGITATLRGRLLGLGGAIGWHYRRLEQRLLRSSDAVVTICPEFAELCAGWGVEPARCHVIENWSPLAELNPAADGRDWAAAQGLAGKRIVLYAGTIGLKHDAGLLLECARHLSSRADTVMVVASEGLGAEQLKAALAAGRIDNLRLLPFQPYDRLGPMLASAAVTLATLNAAAGSFSVPSKITSYLGAGRPVVISAPAENLATRTILRLGAGLAVPPNDSAALAMAIGRLLDDEALRIGCGERGRAFAEAAFDSGRIADRFEAVFRNVTPVRPHGG